jgi:hypothetical protein
MGLFGSGGRTVGVPAFGPEFTIRKNGFEYVLSAMYASYAMDPTPFKAKSDGADAWEIVDTDVKALYLMSDFLWTGEVSPKFSFLYGAGFGIAAIFGDIHRGRHSRRQWNLTSDPNTWVPCPSNAAGTGPDPVRTRPALRQQPLRRLHRAELGERRLEAHRVSVVVAARPGFASNP